MRAALSLTAILLLGACNMSADAREDKGDHQNVRRDFQVGAFQKVGLAGPHDVVVTVGGAPSVRAEGDKAEIDRLDIRVENGELKIGTKRDEGWSWHFGGGRHRHDRVTIYVTAPSLAAAAIAGSGDMKIDKVTGSGFNASIAGSGDMHLASLNVGEAHFSLAGSGDISAAGKAGKATISVAGHGDIVASGLEIADATISVMGSGDVTARATQTADVSVMGSGDVTLSGPAKCSIHKMGSGDVHCGG
ncbi:MAG: hypothetical protein QOH81_857 [Sphingomonadales bacterium]|jgi:hypothetical protein|nr:hypothetical protein [Sphingomonadales bacterium]